MEQHLHSIHCHLYLRTETIMFAVNCKHVGCPTTRTSKEHGHGTRIFFGTMERGCENLLSGCEQKGARTVILCRRTVNSKLYIFVFFSTNYFIFFFMLFFRSIESFFIFDCVCTKILISTHKYDFLIKDVFHLSSALKTSGIMIRPRVSAQNILFRDICNFFLMLHFEHIVIIWNNRW